MATVLFLNDSQVYPDSSQSIKLTKENPYFTQSDSYTLDVTLPMDIFANRLFFRNINRLEKSKEMPRLTCRLMVDNHTILSGSARVTQVTEKEVKVQLLGGNSEVNFMSDESNYVDELDIGSIVMEERQRTGWWKNTYWADTGVVDTGIDCKDSWVYDETEGKPKICHQYALLDIFKQVLRVFGYTVTECDLDVAPWNKIYVATAKSTRNVAHTLPHWTVRTFVEEFCKFFNVTIIVNQNDKTVTIKSNRVFFANAEKVKIDPVEEFTAEVSEQDSTNAMAVDNLSYDMSDSEHHDYDVIPETVRENAITEMYASENDIREAYFAASDAERSQKIWVCPESRFTGWVHDWPEVGDPGYPIFTEIDMFRPLIRDNEGNETDLKICPVAMGEIEYERSYNFGNNDTTHIYKARLPSLGNPTGDEYKVSSMFSLIAPQAAPSASDEDIVTIQEYISGEESIEKAEKEDRLQVMFWDGKKQWCFRYVVADDLWERYIQIVTGFTHRYYKDAPFAETHESWSMSLNKSGEDKYIGQLHVNGFSFKLKTKLCVKFLSLGMPDPKKIFLINNKIYGCEKIEAQIDNYGMSELMTGYFYEMVEE